MTGQIRGEGDVWGYSVTWKQGPQGIPIPQLCMGPGPASYRSHLQFLELAMSAFLNFGFQEGMVVGERAGQTECGAK